jgi:tripartite-type tricarboxylate transporter receptor subunit TctC
MKLFTSTILAAGITAAALVLPSAGFAEYPEKPVSFVVPWPPEILRTF